MKHTSKLLSIIAIFIVSLAMVYAQDNPADVAITLERTPCFGACPVYKITIMTDGTIRYEGTDHVEVTGEQTYQIEPETVAQMVQAFEEAGYFDWDEAYDERTVSDLPTIITSVTNEDGTHEIVRYVGDSSAPIALPYLEYWVDTLANTAMWTGTQPNIANISHDMLSPSLTLQREPCFGMCPVYSIAVYPDGVGVYVGFANVENMGVHIFEVDPAMLENTIQIAQISGYFTWADEYTEQLMTDQAYYRTMINTEQFFKQIIRYAGDPNAPIGLKWVEDSIDRLIPEDME